MKTTTVTLLAFIGSISISFAQIPVEDYRSEIENLKTKEQINTYWKALHTLDQEVLVNTTNLTIADSISISNMIKTTLLFDIHGTTGYQPKGYSGTLPIINLSHNYVDESQIAYWPTIEKCAEIGGLIESFGGKYPAYQLESVSLKFYNYSVVSQEQIYPHLMKKLHDIKRGNIIDELSESFEYQKKLRQLNEVEVLNSWHQQSFNNRLDEGTFSIVKMSDDALYVKRFRRIHKLELISDLTDSKIYRVENEPFGWTYIYKEDGGLILRDDEDNILITYTQAK